MHKGFIRQKIGQRIENRRNKSRQEVPQRAQSDGGYDDSSSRPSSMPSFSQLRREASADGFLVVDDKEDNLASSVAIEEEEEAGVAHHPLHQLENEDAFSDEDLEKLDLDDDEPQPKVQEDEVKSDCSVKSKPWMEQADREVYEKQLTLFQEQLTSALIENQTLQGDIATLRRENAILSTRVKTKTSSSESSENNSASPMKLEASERSGGRESGSFGGSMLTVTSSENGFETVTMSPDARVALLREQERARKRGRFQSIMEWIYDFVADFTEEQSSPDDKVPEDPLTAKKLKDNIQRLMKTSKPWREFGDFIQGILQWKNTAESLVVFLIYMYCVWQGWIIPMLLFLAVLMLTLTYLRTSGLAEQFGFHPRASTMEPSVDELKLGDKLQLVKKVAQTCQNKAEFTANSLEKAQNLFLWHQPSATRRVYINLWLGFVASVLFPNSYVLTVVGLFLGIKLFIIDNIYRKYPKVKERHDTVARLWKSLPTNAELLQRQAFTEEQLQSSSNSAASFTSEDGHTTTQLSEDEESFCRRFQVSPDELPLPSWTTGKRCSVMDRDRPLTLTRSGRLYLTHSHLFFERNNRSQRDAGRFSIALKDIMEVVRAKPFAVMPGSGMSIEVTLKTGEKHLFSAILNRDQAFQSILDQGMILGLPWGTDIDRRVREVKRKKDTSPSSSSKSKSESADEEEGSTKKE